MDADQVNSLVEKARAEALARRQSAADELRGILLQTGKPSAAAEGRIADAIELLGIKGHELPNVLEVVNQLDRFEVLMADLPARVAAVGVAHKKLAEFDAAAAVRRQQLESELLAERLPLEAAEGSALSKQHETREAQQWLSTFRMKWQAIVEGVDYEEIQDRNRPRGVPRGARAPS